MGCREGFGLFGVIGFSGMYELQIFQLTAGCQLAFFLLPADL
jgi:hypothetical protein